MKLHESDNRGEIVVKLIQRALAHREFVSHEDGSGMENCLVMRTEVEWRIA